MTDRTSPTTTEARRLVQPAVMGVLTDARRGHAGLFWFAVAMAVLAAVAVVGIAVDPRAVLGAPTWAKPLKFALSFGLYALALAWMLAMVVPRSRTGAVLGWILVSTSAIEIAVIAIQAARGRRSHFNGDTPLDETLFSIMGATVAVIWLVTAALAVLVIRRGAADPAMTSAVRLGLVIGLVGMALGTLMVMQPGTGAHSVGVADGGPGIPLLGWSTVGGDLRIGHFVGMHALQVLPLLAAVLVAGRRRGLGDSARRALVRVAAAGYLGMVGLLTWQALRGQPLLAPDATTLAALASLSVGTVIAAFAVTRRQTVEAPLR